MAKVKNDFFDCFSYLLKTYPRFIMEILLYIYIFIFWTTLGSFGSVVISRLKEKKSGIVTGRSECPLCKHRLAFYDLFPIFSYLSTGGKCRYCKAPISPVYPLLEITMGALFILTTYFFVDLQAMALWDMWEVYKLCFYLLLDFWTILYVFYDILYFEIPDRVMAGLIALTFGTVALQTLFPESQILGTFKDFTGMFSLWENLTIIGYGALMIVAYYVIMIKGLDEKTDLLILALMLLGGFCLRFLLDIPLEENIMGSALIASFGVFSFLFLQIVLSWGRWMGGGDLRIAVLMGLLVGGSFAFQSVMASYIAWSIIWLGIIAYTKTKVHYKIQKSFTHKVKKILHIKEKPINIDTKIPFGPFLAIGIYVILCYGESLTSILQDYLTL